MGRSTLSTPEQPQRISMLRWIYEALASMYLAIFVIVGMASVLAWATFIESKYGTEAVHFAVYGAWWFAGLLGLLGVNVLCAALIRFPWRRHQTGFVITHAGILVLLAGCIYSAAGGIDAQMPILEGGVGHLAYERTRHFEIKIIPDASEDGKFSVIDVPFASGPFNWDDYDQLREPYWHVAHRDTGVICDQQGILLEVLDFYRIWSFQPHDQPGEHFVPEPFDKDMARRMYPLVRVRLTVDGESDEFWLTQWQAPLFDIPVSPLQRHTVAGNGRRVELMLHPDSADVGLNIYLDKFQRKLDPGSSSMVSHYSSLVDFVAVEADPKASKEQVDVVEEGVLITLNEPITRTDPTTGRSYRIYQEGFDGPWKPGSAEYDEHLGGRVLRGEKMPRDELYQSTLTVNYDPGRGLKYFGCLMIVAGIAVMFYMKAYFFTRRPRRDELEPGTERL